MELGSPLGTKVAEHIGVPVRFLQQLDLPPDQAKAFPEQPLHSHCPPLQLAPGEFREGRVEGKGSFLYPSLGASERLAPPKDPQSAVRVTCPAQLLVTYSPENERPTCPPAQYVFGVEGNLAHHGKLLS